MTRKKPPTPKDSPITSVYRDWMGNCRGALQRYWRSRYTRLAARLQTQARAVDDILEDDEWWTAWVAGYIGVLLSLEEAAVIVGADAGEQLLVDYWAMAVDDDLVNLAVSQWARDHAGELAGWLTETDKAMLRHHLAAWVESGDTLPQLLERVRSFLDNPARARRVAVTEATRAYAQGNMIAWRESGIVTGKMWYTARDERVCPICGALHGQLTELDGQEWHHLRDEDKSVGLSVEAPPAHPHCRCIISPWVGELDWK